MDETTLILDSTTIRVHQHGAPKKGLLNPLYFMLSRGNRNDICMAKELLEGFDLHGKLILADKGYDSNKFVKWAQEHGATVVIPSRITVKHPRKIDRVIYK